MSQINKKTKKNVKILIRKKVISDPNRGIIRGHAVYLKFSILPIIPLIRYQF